MADGLRGPLVGLAVVVAIGALAVGYMLSLGSGDDEIASRDAASTRPAPDDAGARLEPDPIPAAVPTIHDDYVLVFGERTTLVAAELPEDRPVVLGLALPVPATGAASLPVRVRDDSRRDLTTHAVVEDAALGTAHLEIEPGWLSPGEYLLHLTTTEPSHLPLRRYSLIVR
jgi:hypothetical protein